MARGDLVNLSTVVVTQTSNAVSSAAFVALASRSPSLAAVLLKISANMANLLLINGAILRQPFYILRYIQNISLVPFGVERFLTPLTKLDGCQRPEEYVRKEIECNIVSNFSEDLFMIYGVVLFSILMTGVSKCIRRDSTTNHQKLRSDKSIFQKILIYICTTYDFKYAVLLLEGVQCELLAFMLINMIYNPYNISNIICLKFLAYYCYVEFHKCRIYFSKSFDSSHDTIYKYVLQAYKTPISLLQRLMPALATFKNVSLCLVLVVLNKYRWPQMIIALCIEIIYLILIVKSNVKASRLELTMDWVISLQNTTYIVVNMIATGRMSEESRQRVLGTIAAATCLSCTAIGGIVCLCMLVASVYEFLHKNPGKSRLRKDAKVLPVLKVSQIEDLSSRQRLALESDGYKHWLSPFATSSFQGSHLRVKRFSSLQRVHDDEKSKGSPGEK